MSSVSSRTTATVPIPFATPHEVTVQKLAGRHLERAREEAQINWQKQVERKGGVRKQKELLKAFKDDEPVNPPANDKPEEKLDPLAGLDPYTLCRFGVQSLTSDDSLDEEDVIDLDGETVKKVKLFFDMSEDELKWYATEVMKVTSPRLFQTKAEHKETQKNDSAA